ncbi:MAG: UbiA-like polyprenyltransferase [Chthoniobacterales bacterium]
MPPVAPASPANPVARFLQLIRFSHTIFALPFAFGALFVAARGIPAPRNLLLVLLAMVLARTAAMLFNRLADWSIDQRNPRTAGRHLLASRRAAAVLLVGCTLGFIATAIAINRMTALLSPVALALIFLYSLTKRFTDATHFFLGLALAVAPAGAWIAETGRLDFPPLILSLGVICWVAGFDLIYATQDYEFDRREKLRSLVVRIGIPRALRLAQSLHLAMFAALLGFGLSARLGVVYFSAMPLIAAALWYEHRSAARLDLAAINRAFFQSNAFVSALFFVAVALDVVRRAY